MKLLQRWLGYIPNDEAMEEKAARKGKIFYAELIPEFGENRPQYASIKTKKAVEPHERKFIEPGAHFEWTISGGDDGSADRSVITFDKGLRRKFEGAITYISSIRRYTSRDGRHPASGGWKWWMSESAPFSVWNGDHPDADEIARFNHAADAEYACEMHRLGPILATIVDYAIQQREVRRRADALQTDTTIPMQELTEVLQEHDILERRMSDALDAYIEMTAGKGFVGTDGKIDNPDWKVSDDRA